MNTSDLLDDYDLEKRLKQQFGATIEVGTVIARHLDVGQASYATVFLSNKKQLYCYIEGSARLLMADVRKIVTRMGLRAELYLPPKGQATYFDDVARAKFREVFPGRREVSEADLRYYRTLAPYSPALLQVAEVTSGMIYCADNDAHGGWRPAVKFAYRRIKTS